MLLTEINKQFKKCTVLASETLYVGVQNNGNRTICKCLNDPVAVLILECFDNNVDECVGAVMSM
jgi:hypothetical protein